MTDELLLGLLDNAEELCISDFEVFEVFEDEAFQVVDPEKCIHSCSYLKLIAFNGTIELEDCWGVEGKGPDIAEKVGWSVTVNIDKEVGSERRTWPWFESFREKSIVKVDTGQNLKYCVQVLGSFLGSLWYIVRSLFGYKERFSN